MTLLTPLAALVMLAALLPVAAVYLARRRLRKARRVLRLQAPERGTALVRPVLATSGVVLLGLAAAQPALTHATRPHIRRDAQAVFVFDTSRSMAAAAAPSKPTRLDRAIAAATRLRDAIPEVESGILTLTDRVLPDLLPVADRRGFDAVAERAVRIESPPPRSTSARATSYAALDQVASGNVFAPSATRRLVVLLTDGESTPVETSAVARALAPARGYRFVAVRFWQADESVFDADGKAEPAYRPDPSGAATLADTAAALGGRSFDEDRLEAASDYLRRSAGTGPTATVGAGLETRYPLGPWLALVALLVLAAGVTSWSAVLPRVAWTRR
jgi:hypothetical protein